MPTSAPNVNPLRLQQYIVQDGQGNREVQDRYLQSTTYEEEDTEDEESQGAITVTRRRRQWGHYYVMVYTARALRSLWFYLGVGLFVIGVLITIAAVGMSFQEHPWLNATAIGVVSAVGTAIAGGGLTVALTVQATKYERGQPTGNAYYLNVPIGQWEQVQKTTHAI